MATVLVLTGSPSRVSRTAALAQHVADELVLDGHDVTRLDVRDLPPAALLAADTSEPAVAAAVRLLRAELGG